MVCAALSGLQSRKAAKRDVVHRASGLTHSVGRRGRAQRALSLMDAAGENHLPVVDNARDLVVIGILHHNRVLREYNKALLSARAEEHGER